MPGGITLLESLSADIPTPAAGKDTIFINSATGLPSYKDDLGVVHTLVGANGANGAAGPIGPMMVRDDVLYPDDLIVASAGLSAVGGRWELAATQALSGAIEWNFVGLGIYTDICVRIIGVTAGSGITTYLRVSIDNGANYLSSSGDYVQVAGNGTPTNDTELEFYTTTATAARAGEITIEGANLSTPPKFARSNFFATDGVLMRYMPTTSPINAVKVLSSTGVNFTGGTAYVLGRR